MLGGSILALVAWSRGRLRLPGRHEFLVCAVSAFLFWICGNGFALLALRELPSGFVAMAMGTIPLWSAAYQALRTRRLPDQPLTLASGFVGLALIYFPTFSSAGGLHASWFTLAALIVAPVAWVIATSLQPGLLGTMDGTTVAGIQLVMGGLMACMFALVQGTPLPSPPGAQTILAGLYLALFASAISFQSYVRATTLFSPGVVSAFAYVNPVVGVLLGWLVLSERPVLVSLVGMVIVIASVVLTMSSIRRPVRYEPAIAHFEREKP